MTNSFFHPTISREGTGAAKWDARQQLFGKPDVIPMWVADMDFKAPPEVIQALEDTAKQGIYGYSSRSDSMLQSIVDWIQRRHHWTIQQNWIIEAPGVVPSLALAVQAYTEPGDQVLIQSPVYYPFYDVIKNNQRECVLSPLKEVDGSFEMDFESLEKKFAEGVRLMFLCSPHNPVGRVWRQQELARLGEICERYDVLVVADEIHCDLIFSTHPHIPFASLNPALSKRTITCMAPSKTFNLAGLQASYMVVADPALRKKMKSQLSNLGLSISNHFAIVATETAYRFGERWLDELKSYINEQFALVRNALSRQNWIKPILPEGTYLIWLDCRGMNLAQRELQQFMIQEAGIGLSDGTIFGPGGEGFLRMNVACSRGHLEAALTGLDKALRAYCDGVKREEDCLD